MFRSKTNPENKKINNLKKQSSNSGSGIFRRNSNAKSMKNTKVEHTNKQEKNQNEKSLFDYKVEDYGVYFNKITNEFFETPNIPNQPGKDFYNEDFFEEFKINDLKKLENSNKSISTKENIKLKLDDGVYKEGWLTKEGRRVKNWKKRWFILKERSLCYYTAKNKLKGEISLELCSVSIHDKGEQFLGKKCLLLTKDKESKEENDEEKKSGKKKNLPLKII
jgi:hypothetical protein